MILHTVNVRALCVCVRERERERERERCLGVKKHQDQMGRWSNWKKMVPPDNQELAVKYVDHICKRQLLIIHGVYTLDT